MIEIYSRAETPSIDVICGKSQELFSSRNISFAIITVETETTSHKHVYTEEIYYILKGKGILTIGQESIEAQTGDLIPIDEFHFLKNLSSHPLELLVINHPAFDPKDVIESLELKK